MDTEKKNPIVAVGVTLAVAVVLLLPLAVYAVFRAQVGGPPGLRDPAAESAEPATKQQASRAFQEFDTSVEKAPAPVRRPSAMVVARVQPPPPARPAPTPANIPVGMEKSKLIADFGRPNMITTEVTQGRAFETYRYLRPEVSTETVVLLSGGKVVGASSTGY
jgi:hypothetical protein